MKHLITILASLIATATVAQADSLPKHFGPGFSADDVGFVEGRYDMPIWVVSEPGFSNGADTCTLIVSIDCQGTVVFSDGGEASISCDEEVPTGSTFVALCRNDPT